MSDHPVCSASERGHFIDVAATPPLEEGSCSTCKFIHTFFRYAAGNLIYRAGDEALDWSVRALDAVEADDMPEHRSGSRHRSSALANRGSGEVDSINAEVRLLLLSFRRSQVKQQDIEHHDYQRQQVEKVESSHIRLLVFGQVALLLFRTVKMQNRRP